MRKAILVVLVLVLGATPTGAQGWAEKMFRAKKDQSLTHDFGNVPHGAQLFHRFHITNIYAVRMEITGVTSGCGCVKAEAARRVLAPRESTTIDVSMDARRFTGSKTVGIRVTVGPEFVSSAELRVTANSRADVVFNPGQVSFGPVTRGQRVRQVIEVDYAGVLDWKVTEVIARDVPFDVSLARKPATTPGQIGYTITVTLKPDAPVGALKNEIYLKTNDPASPLVPVLVEANVQTPLTVAPASWNLGTVRAGTAQTRRVVVRGSRPFRILAVEGTGDGVTLATDIAALAAPVQTITFRCQPAQAGPFKRVLKILTDLQEAPIRFTVSGNVGP